MDSLGAVCVELTESLSIGDAQLLETVDARAEVFQSGGGPEGEVADELHQWLLGGEFEDLKLPTQGVYGLSHSQGRN